MLMTHDQIISVALCLLALSVSSVYDVKYRRVPNAVTFPMMLAGLLLTYLMEFNLLPYKLLFASCLFFFGMTGLLGLGDIKLLIGLGLVWKPEYALFCAALASLFIFLHHILRRRTGLGSLFQKSCLCILHLQPTQERNTDNSASFAPYLFLAYILIQGGLLLWQN